MRILQEGDRGVAIAPGHGRVPVIYEYRDVELESGTVVHDVLVGVHQASSEVLVFPAQSTPKVKESRALWKEEVLEARVPRELDDILRLLADHFGASEKKFSPALIRFYLHAAVEDRRLARRLVRLADGRLARGPRRSRLRVRWGSALSAKVDAMTDDFPGTSQSDLVRGAIVAAKEDILDRRAVRRAKKLEAVAAAV